MSILKNGLLGLVVFGLSGLLGPTGSAAQAAVVIIHGGYDAPPTDRVEHYGPRRGYVWVGGHHGWRHRHYVWVRGHYVRERPGYEYVPGRWERHENHYDWYDGEWHPHR